MDKRLSLALKYYDADLAEDAWAALRELVEEAEPPTEALHLAAALRLEAAAFDDVLSIAERLIVRHPESADGLVLKGEALLAAGREAEAGKVLVQAAEREPRNADAHFNLGLWHHQVGRLAEAEQAYRAALSLRDPFAKAWNNLGNVLDEEGRPTEAVAAFQKAIDQQPEFSSAYNNLGASLAGQGSFAAAADVYAKAIEVDARNNSARVNLGVALLEQGELETASAVFSDVLNSEPDNRDAAHNRLYAEIYAEDAPSTLLGAHTTWGQTVSVCDLPRPQDPRSDRRLRVGYVSPDFRRHSVSFFVEPLLRAHDANEVDVFGYSDVAQPDEVTARLQGYAHHWHNIRGLDDKSVLELVRADKIDVLVDLAGHTAGNRLPVFAQGAAPIQVTSLGYPATTGLPAMSYRFCDAETDPPPNADAWSTEALVRLPDGLHCFQMPYRADDPGPLPMAENGHITFGSFNKLAKISRHTLAMWAEVLRAIPDARLVLKSKPLVEESTRRKLRAAFEDCGISPDRIDLMGWVGGDHEHLALYGRVDVALDTFPYNGTATTCEALWMGVPVVTLAGRGHAARVGASLLTQIGHSEWIAKDSAQFVACTQELSANMARLTDVRRSLRSHMAASSLCDAKGYAISIEAAYRSLWRTLCERDSPGAR
jgi:protein O-GlcNAc transferase